MLKRIRFRDLATQQKFLVVLVVFMLTPYLTISAITYVQLRGNTLQDAYDRQSQTLDLANRLVDLQLQEYERVMQSLYGYQALLPLISQPDEDIRALHYERVTNTIRSIYARTDFVSSVYIFGVQGADYFVDSHSTGAYIDCYQANPQWEQAILNARRGITWIPSFYIENKTNKEPVGPVFSSAMRIHDVVNSLDLCGVCVLNLETALFDTLFTDIRLEDSTLLFITDLQGNIVWGNGRIQATETLPAPLFDTITANQDSFVEASFADTGYVISSKRSAYNDWLYISMTPRQMVLRSQEWVVSLVFTQAAIMLLLIAVGAALIKRHVTNPLEKITVLMGLDRQERAALAGQVPDDRNDEVGRLYRSFNRLDQRVSELLRESLDAEKKANDYRIKILQAQINPHFIYNTLDMIRWMALEEGAEEIGAMIFSLSNILRYSISKKSDIVTLGEEFDCLRNYLTIYGARYENMFRTDWSVQEEILAYRTFRMLLQPLLENVMVHGFKDCVQDGLIKISGRLENGNAVVKIIDNGVGMSAERIFYALSQDSEGIGLSNINERLMLLYGKEYALQIHSEIGKGTAIKIVIPPNILGEANECLRY